MATAQRGRSRSCAFVYSSDRPDPKTFILGCSLAPPSKTAESETDSSLLSRTVTGTTCKLLNGKAARHYNCRKYAGGYRVIHVVLVLPEKLATAVTDMF